MKNDWVDNSRKNGDIGSASAWVALSFHGQGTRYQVVSREQDNIAAVNVPIRYEPKSVTIWKRGVYLFSFTVTK
ncbi:MAG: hypothetical protein B6240_04175 [Desulfobacteraceae bacterium 4572_87]|nr:MAG: hypothetical protein B6240_04175 [Desulfobacteraceae bacterium 4572_87]